MIGFFLNLLRTKYFKLKLNEKKGKTDFKNPVMFSILKECHFYGDLRQRIVFRRKIWGILNF